MLKRRFIVQATLCTVLLLLIAVYAGRLLRLGGHWGIDLGGQEITSLAPETQRYLQRLSGNLALTFFVTPPERMPTHLKTVEPTVRRLLEHLQALNPAHISYRIIDPQRSGAAGIAYAARKKVSPLNVRRVVDDAHDEERIWSSLVLAYEQYPEILLEGIDAVQLPHLAAEIVAHLKTANAPPKPIFAVAAPGPFQLLPQWLSQFGTVVDVDFDNTATIPATADILFWMQPNQLTPAHMRQLKAFMARGRSVVLAGSVYAIGYDVSVPDTTRFRVYPLPSAWGRLLEPFG